MTLATERLEFVLTVGISRICHSVLDARSETLHNSTYTAHTYTVGHKKRSTLFCIITPTFLGVFLHFLYQWKGE